MKLSQFGETGPTKNESLYRTFADPNNPRPADAVAIWTGQTPTVITYYQGIVPTSMVVGHETLHILFKGDHKAVAENLRLGKYGTGDKEDKRANDDINDYLRNNCGVKR
jgi:hypothetical protein